MMENMLCESNIKDLMKKYEKGKLAKEKLDSGDYNPLEENELYDLVLEGTKARDNIVSTNIKLVSFIAKEYVGRGLPFEDLFQSGSMGLVKAVEKYDYNRENKFSTYAALWIKDYITKAIANEGRAVRLPDNIYRKVIKYKKACSELEMELGREASVNEVAKTLKATEDEVLDCIDYVKPIVTLDNNVGDDDTTYCDLIPDDTAISPEKKLMKKKLNNELYNIIKNELNEKEAFALCSYYGLAGKDKLNYEAIGTRLGFSGERARQVVNISIKKLRESNSSADLYMLMQSANRE